MTDLGSLAADFGLDPEPEQTPDPQPTPDASEEAGAEKVVEAAAATGDKGKGEAADKQAEAAGEADPDLTAEENELVRSRPEAEQGETARKLKAARFEDHYLNPDKPAEDVRSYLEGKSPSRYGELEQAIVARRLADPETFAADYFRKSPEGYGKLALAVFNGNPAYFAKALTGREVEAQTLKTALDFYERNRDRVPPDDAPDLSPEELAEVEQWTPEIAGKVKAILESKADVARQRAEVEAAKAKPEPEKPAEERQAELLKQQQAIKADQAKAWDAGYSHFESYIGKKAETAAGVLVTPKERELAPQVALLKDLKREILMQGMGEDLPDFERGLYQWAEGRDERTREAYLQSVAAMGRFSEAREPDNVLSAARKLIPHADKYFDERLNHPVFAQLDALIALAVQAANPKSTAEEIVPGSGGNVSQQKPSDPNAAFYDDAINFGLT